MTGQSALPTASHVREFNGMFKDMHCIKTTLLFDPIIMIVRCPLCANEVTGFSKAWISPDSDEHAMIPLMRLCLGSLLNIAVEDPTTKVQALASRSNQESTLL